MASHTYKTIDTPDGEYIATSDGRLTVLSDKASVERLQAHAPELLAALEGLLETVEDEMRGLIDRKVIRARKVANITEARAAINKANGVTI